MKTLLGWLLLALSFTAQAAIDTYSFSDEVTRQRYRTLVEELRCPMCQNQNIADSNAPIALDLRREIHALLEQGQSDEQIINYLVARYGDFVRYKPPLNPTTWLLWFGPVALLLVGLGGLLLIIRSRRRRTSQTSATVLSPTEQARLASLLDKHD